LLKLTSCNVYLVDKLAIDSCTIPSLLESHILSLVSEYLCDLAPEPSQLDPDDYWLFFNILTRQQTAPGSACTLPAWDLELAMFPKSPDSFGLTVLLQDCSFGLGS
jgi:hypothetical protein